MCSINEYKDAVIAIVAFLIIGYAFAPIAMRLINPKDPMENNFKEDKNDR